MLMNYIGASTCHKINVKLSVYRIYIRYKDICIYFCLTFKINTHSPFLAAFCYDFNCHYFYFHKKT